MRNRDVIFMNDVLKQFWIWLGIEPEFYAVNGIGCNGKEECDFPDFMKLIVYAEEIVAKNIVSEEAINELLTILAIDNESENTLNYIVEHSTSEQLEVIISHGMTHLFFEARWQLAEILFRRKPTNYIDYLLFLSTDAHSYVKQRAGNCLMYLK